MSQPDVSLIVVSFNTREQTIQCVGSLLAQTGTQTEVIVVDNASSDGTVEGVGLAYPSARVLTQPDNLGFGCGCNAGASVATGRYLGFFNSDCVAEPECVQRLASYLDAHADVSVAVPRLVSSSGEIERNIQLLPTVRTVISEHVFGRVQDPYRAAEQSQPVEVEVCSGAALLIRREDFEAVGGFDQSFFMYVEDVELCRRLSTGRKRIMYVPDAVAEHRGGVSAAPHSAALSGVLARNRETYMRRAMGPARAASAVLALRLGRGIAPLRNRVLSGVRR